MSINVFSLFRIAQNGPFRFTVLPSQEEKLAIYVGQIVLISSLDY